jgi:hypothetical protein
MPRARETHRKQECPPCCSVQRIGSPLEEKAVAPLRGRCPNGPSRAHMSCGTLCLSFHWVFALSDAHCQSGPVLPHPDVPATWARSCNCSFVTIKVKRHCHGSVVWRRLCQIREVTSPACMLPLLLRPGSTSSSESAGMELKVGAVVNQRKAMHWCQGSTL